MRWSGKSKGKGKGKGKEKRYSATKADRMDGESRIELRWAEVRPKITKTLPSMALVAAILKLCRSR